MERREAGIRSAKAVIPGLIRNPIWLTVVKRKIVFLSLLRVKFSALLYQGIFRDGTSVRRLIILIFAGFTGMT